MLDIDELIDHIRRIQSYTPASSFGSVERLERREGRRLPQDMLRFFSEFDGARLFGSEYIVLDPDGVLPFDTVIHAVDPEVPHVPDSWIAFCRTRDGHWVGIDLEPTSAGGHPVAAFRQAGECNGPTVEIVAPSFACFLAFAMVSRRHPYWLDLDPVGHSRQAS